MTTPEVRPNHTIYINNLNEKIKKDGEFCKRYSLAFCCPVQKPSVRYVRFLYPLQS